MNFSLLLSRMQSSCNVSVRYGNANVCHKWCACEIACIALFAMFSCRSESTFIFMSSSFTSFLLQFSSFSRCLSLFLRSYRARSCRSPAFFLPILFALPLSLYARFFQPRETFSIYFPHPSSAAAPHFYQDWTRTKCNWYFNIAFVFEPQISGLVLLILFCGNCARKGRKNISAR